MDRNDRIIRLINNISKGKRTYKQVKRELDAIENKFGKLDLLYKVEDRNDLEYAQKIIDDAYIGGYSRESILKLSMIYGDKCQRYMQVKVFICIVVFIVLLVIGLLILRD